MLITLRGQRVKIPQSQPPLPEKERHQKTKKSRAQPQSPNIHQLGQKFFFDELQIG